MGFFFFFGKDRGSRCCPHFSLFEINGGRGAWSNPHTAAGLSPRGRGWKGSPGPPRLPSADKDPITFSRSLGGSGGPSAPSPGREHPRCTSVGRPRLYRTASIARVSAVGCAGPRRPFPPLPAGSPGGPRAVPCSEPGCRNPPFPLLLLLLLFPRLPAPGTRLLRGRRRAARLRGLSWGGRRRRGRKEEEGGRRAASSSWRWVM